MALDGLVISALVEELSQLLPNNKIEKVYQPENDEIILLIRSQGKNYKLLLSANSSYPRVHFTNFNKENPAAPPTFCMLLRKHLQGGRIVSIHQPDFERIIHLQIESLDELHIMRSKELIIEMTGRHSNIILIDHESRKILDSVKRVSFEVSRYRQILPGLTYAIPPTQDKANPLLIDSYERFQEKLGQDKQLPIHKALYITFTGISPLVARELCYRANIEGDHPVLSLDDQGLHRLFDAFLAIMEGVKAGKFRPTIYIDQENMKYVDFSILSLQHFSYYEEETVDTVSNMLETFYRNRAQKERMKQKFQDLRKTVETKLHRLYNKVENLKGDYGKAKNADYYKVMGDLITAHIYQIHKGLSSIEVINFYDENQALITIPLDKMLTPSQNAQRYYKQYNKFKTALAEVENQLAITKEEIAYLEQVLVSTEQATQLSDVEEIRNELIETGYLKKRANHKKFQGKKSTYLTYLSSDGNEILVGKNNRQNDELTFKIATKEDLWFHVKDMPGSHVILKSKGEAPSNLAITEAASLAAYYSKGKNGTKIAVDYTQRRNVRKPSGAKPGMVIYDHYTTVLVDGDEKAISPIKQSAF